MSRAAPEPRRPWPFGHVRRAIRPAAGLTVLALALTAGRTWAGNGDLPRTPMIHQGERCLTVVDRSVDPVVHLAYTIPFADTCLTADELPGSRSHQLLAFCRSDPWARVTPHWHTRAEADAAAAAGQTDEDPVPAADVLDDSDYAGCWRPILPPERRRPITCAAARPGVDWDTTGLPVGAYLVRGYTYEPPTNFWAPRHGLYKVVDHPDPAMSPPAVAIANRDTYLWNGQTMLVRLCVDAMPGSTVTLAYGLNVPEPEWTPFISDQPVDSGTLDLEFVPPGEVAGEFLTVRAEIVDPMQRRFVAHMQGEINVQVVEDPQGSNQPVGVDDTGEPAYDFCADNPAADQPLDCPDAGSSSSGDDTGASGSGDTGDTGDGPPGTGSGCGCRSSSPLGAAVWLLLALSRRRRR